MALISQGNVGVRRTELPFLVEANVSQNPWSLRWALPNLRALLRSDSSPGLRRQSDARHLQE
jgi:hypothetical protein